MHLAIITDQEEYKFGYGRGLENLSFNTDMIIKFKNFINKYNYPLVDHNAPFDKKFLIHFEWIEPDYKIFDSLRALRIALPDLSSHKIEYLISHFNINATQSHTALDDTKVLFEIISKAKPTTWYAIGEKTKSSSKKSGSFHPKLDSLKKDFDIIKNIFNGQTIVFTGKCSHPRNKLIELAKKAGAISNSNSITRKTDILVVGHDCGSKLAKAKELGLKIISTDEFFNLVSEIHI